MKTLYQKKKTIMLNLERERLGNEVDLTDYTNLETLVYNNSTTSLIINSDKIGLLTREGDGDGSLKSIEFKQNSPNLTILKLYREKIQGDLNIFSHLTNLKHLDLGNSNSLGNYNNFYGSLKSLENCKQLEFLCIGQQVNIKDGLEYLPLDKLTYFGCHGTVFQEWLRPFDYDIKAWKMVNHPHLFTNLEQKMKNKIDETQAMLAMLKRSNVSEKRIQRLKDKVQILKDKFQVFFWSKEELIREIKRLELENQRLDKQNIFLKEQVQARSEARQSTKEETMSIPWYMPQRK